MARHLGLSTEDFKRAYVVERAQRFGLLLLVQEGGHCIFLRYRGDEAECAINAFKPIACRKWTPSLSRPECREGLHKCKTSGPLILPGQIYESQEDLTTFYRSLEDKELRNQ
jgi:Fe-S-cluster containining protein